MAQYDDVKTSTVALFGLIGAIITFALVVFVMVLYYRFAAQERFDKLISQAPAELSDVTANQQAKLAEYRWIDQSKGVVAIPISRAMNIVVAELLAEAGHKPPTAKPPATAKEATDAR